MDIPALSMAMANLKLSEQVGVTMLKKNMDTMEQTGEQIVQMIQASQIPTGSKIDISV